VASEPYSTPIRSFHGWRRRLPILLRFAHDPSDQNSTLNSNGAGNFFSAGRTRSRSQIQRGLVQFDFSSLPQGARIVPGTLELHLTVVDVPGRDTTPRPFWFVALSGLAQPWGEGTSFADINQGGSGSGALATDGDATWFHTALDSNIHDADTFAAGGTGYGSAQGALGGDGLDPAALFGSPAGIAGDSVGPTRPLRPAQGHISRRVRFGPCLLQATHSRYNAANRGPDRSHRNPIAAQPPTRSVQRDSMPLVPTTIQNHRPSKNRRPAHRILNVSGQQ